jgi:hypothetical protein
MLRQSREETGCDCLRLCLSVRQWKTYLVLGLHPRGIKRRAGHAVADSIFIVVDHDCLFIKSVNVPQACAGAYIRVCFNLTAVSAKSSVRRTSRNPGASGHITFKASSKSASNL